MSAKDPCDKGLFPRVLLLGDGRTFKRWSLMGGLQVIGTMPLKKRWDPSPFLFPVFTSQP
jgi:hypothetical protein